MGKRRPNDSVTTNPYRTTTTAGTGPASAPSAVPPPSEPASSPNSLPFILAAVGLIGVIGLVIVVWLQAPSRDDRPDPTELEVCQKFLELHNSAHPAAQELLGAAPVIPAEPITEAHADKLATELFLRDEHLVIERCRQKAVENGVRVFVFRTNGNVLSPQIRTLQSDGGEMNPPPQRIMINPDLHVEVRDGKILAVRATVQRDN